MDVIIDESSGADADGIHILEEETVVSQSKVESIL